MHVDAPESAQSSGLSNAFAEPPRRPRGGRRPGAGRPRKQRDPAEVSKLAARVDVGDAVWVWIRPFADRPELSPRAALVVDRDPERPGALSVRVFYLDGSDEILTAAFSTSPAEGCWTLPPNRGGPGRPGD